MNADTVHESANVALVNLLADIMYRGSESAPRGKKVTELLGVSVSFDMSRPLVTLCARDLGYRFAPAEAAWILSGDNRVDTIKQYSRRLSTSSPTPVTSWPTTPTRGRP